MDYTIACSAPLEALDHAGRHPLHPSQPFTLYTVKPPNKLPAQTMMISLRIAHCPPLGLRPLIEPPSTPHPRNSIISTSLNVTTTTCRSIQQAITALPHIIETLSITHPRNSINSTSLNGTTTECSICQVLPRSPPPRTLTRDQRVITANPTQLILG